MDLVFALYDMLKHMIAIASVYAPLGIVVSVLIVFVATRKTAKATAYKNQ